MIKPSLVFIFLPLYFTDAEPVSDNNYPTFFLMFKNPRSLDLKQYPFDEKKFLEDEKIIKLHLCPAENDEDVRNIEVASKRSYKLKYCLFEKHFKKGEDRVCKKEVNPVLVEMKDDNESVLRCGLEKQYTIHALSYYDCGEIKNLIKFREERFQKYPMYNQFLRNNWVDHTICYDTVRKQVVWTKYKIMTPQLLQNPYFKNQKTRENEIRTNSYFMDDNLFVSLKQRYEIEAKKDRSIKGNFIMVPQPQIPLEHHALPIMKKAINHYLNMAPIWETLVPLLKSIDERILKAQFELESRNPTSYDELIIYTRVGLSIQTYGKSLVQWFSLVQFDSNIWFKFIHRKETKSGVLIIIHNIPENPPPVGCLFGIENPCAFEQWSDDENVRLSITEDVKKYARCCHPTRQDIMNIFSYDPEELGNYLNINSIESLSQDSVKFSESPKNQAGGLKKRAKKTGSS